MGVSLWKVSKGVVIIDKDYVRAIDVFSRMLHRVIRIKGDSVGRNKTATLAEFIYIWFMEDWKSPYIGKSEKVRHKLAIEDSGLNDMRNIDNKPVKWVADDIVLEGRKKYAEVQETSLVKLLIEAESSIDASSELLKFLNHRVQTKIITLREQELSVDEKGLTEEQELHEKERIDSAITLCFKATADVQRMVKELPSTLDIIKELQEKVIIESSGAVKGKGGRSIGNRAAVD